MNITTIIPPMRELHGSRIGQDVLTCLRRQPGVPLDLQYVADSIAGLTLAHVERAVRILEGPTSGPSPKAYVHYCRVNNQAVFIP